MRRREVIALSAAGLAGAPFVVLAQQRRPPARLGYIWIGTRGSEHSTLQGLRIGLLEFGYVEGRDYVLEERYDRHVPGAAGRLKTAHSAQRHIVAEHMREQRTRSPGRSREVIRAVQGLEAARHDGVRGILHWHTPAGIRG